MTTVAADAPTALLPLLAGRDLDAPLAWCAGVPVSGRTYLADVAWLAGGLAARMPGGGPVINLCNDRYAFAVALGAALACGQPSLLPPDARPDTLARLRQSHPDLVALTDEPSLETPGLARVLVPFGAAGAGGQKVTTVGDEGVASGDAASVPGIAGDLHAVSLLTSGSTGVPQPHAKTWTTLCGDVAAAVGRLAREVGRSSLDGLTLVATVPVQHSYGLESSALLALLGGAAFESGRPFFPADIAAALASVPRPRALVTTPFHLKTLLLSGIALPPVDLILSATAPLSPQLAAQAEAMLGGVLVEIYGSTESGQVAARRPTVGEVWETFGEIRVRAEAVPAAAEGAVAIAAAERFVFEGDFIPEPTPMADVLDLLDDRRFRLLGRSNDLIHVAGKRSSLGHLNYHLNSIPGVADGAFWLPDEQADGVVRPVAFVVAPTLGAAEVVAALRQRIESVFVPRRVVHVASLPREGTGKLTARALREFALAQLAGDDTPVRVTHEVPADHPAFAGHFPGQPLLPGALLVAEVTEVLLRVPAMVARLGPAPTLTAVKFLAPVRPGAELLIELLPERGTARGVRFEVRQGDTVAASGRWIPVASGVPTASAAPAPAPAGAR